MIAKDTNKILINKMRVQIRSNKANHPASGMRTAQKAPAKSVQTQKAKKVTGPQPGKPGTNSPPAKPAVQANPNAAIISKVESEFSVY